MPRPVGKTRRVIGVKHLGSGYALRMGRRYAEKHDCVLTLECGHQVMKRGYPTTMFHFSCCPDPGCNWKKGDSKEGDVATKAFDFARQYPPKGPVQMRVEQMIQLIHSISRVDGKHYEQRYRKLRSDAVRDVRESITDQQHKGRAEYHQAKLAEFLKELERWPLDGSIGKRGNRT